MWCRGRKCRWGGRYTCGPTTCWRWPVSMLRGSCLPTRPWQRSSSVTQRWRNRSSRCCCQSSYRRRMRTRTTVRSICSAPHDTLHSQECNRFSAPSGANASKGLSLHYERKSGRQVHLPIPPICPKSLGQHNLCQTPYRDMPWTKHC